MLKSEWGAEGNGKVLHLIQSLVKLKPRVLILRWKTCIRQNYSLSSCACSDEPVLGQNTHDDDDDDDDVLRWRATSTRKFTRRGIEPEPTVGEVTTAVV